MTQTSSDLSDEYSQLLLLADQFNEKGRLDLAQEIWEACLKNRPGDLNIRHKLSYCYLRQNRLSSALNLLLDMVREYPSDLLTRQLLGRTCLRLMEPDLAEVHFNKILSLKPVNSSAMSGLVDVALAKNDAPLAKTWAQKIIQKHPNSILGWLAMANALEAMNQSGEALKWLDLWVQRHPNEPSGRYHRARSLLKHGRTIEGLRDFKFVYDAEIQPKPALNSPWWNGSRIDNLLVVADQGLGDAIMLSRYLEEARRHVNHVTLACPSSLMGWLSTALAAQVIDIHHMDEFEHTAHIPIGALPGALQLSQDPYQIDAMRNMRRGLKKTGLSDPRLAAPFKVGISLSCSHLHSTEQYPQTRRSCDPQQVGPLLSQQDAHYFNLQKDPFPKGAQALRHRWHELGPELSDFSETASWVNAMDVIVTVDSVLVHVAGLLDKPTFLLLPFVSDWRWQTDPKSNPWYPSVTLYRQPSAGDWSAASAVIAQDINRLRACL